MPSVLTNDNDVRPASDWLPPHRQRPLSMEFSTSPDGKVSVSIRHDDGRSVFACTSSYTTLIEMEPGRWREFIDAIRLKLDTDAGRCGWGYDERLRPCGKAGCEMCVKHGTLTPEQADTAGAT